MSQRAPIRVERRVERQRMNKRDSSGRHARTGDVDVLVAEPRHEAARGAPL